MRSAFCVLRGVPASSLFSWRRKLRGGQAGFQTTPGLGSAPEAGDGSRSAAERAGARCCCSNNSVYSRPFASARTLSLTRRPGVDGPWLDVLDLPPQHCQPRGKVLVEGPGGCPQNLAGTGRQVGREPLLHAVAAKVHDPLHAEIKVGMIELEQIAEQGLESFEGLLGHRGRHCTLRL
jgi:hypothetical protein